MSSAFSRAIDRYVDNFGENYPIFMLPALDEEETVRFIDRCIRENKRALDYYPPDKKAIY